MESNQNSRSLARPSKTVKNKGTTDSKIANFDIVRAKRAKILNRLRDSFNFFLIQRRKLTQAHVRKDLQKLE